ncbi:MAG: NAD-dependent succinate-semialdehyde dehydrogenase [Flavobacterium sp.]|nr:MAG: NAD-dependent succinate-semialdehyde dehydrogenase [Flavobacterium sp.]
MSEIRSINPYNGQLIESFREHTTQEIESIIDKAHNRFNQWKKSSFTNRSECMMAATAELRANKESYARTISAEMGKPISQAMAEIEKCAWVCEYYATHAEEHLSEEIVSTDAESSYVLYEPMGIVLAVMPWNYPFWQVFRSAAPALMAGNIGLLKHASNVFGSALNIEKVFRKAGFPENCFTTLKISSDKVKAVIENPKVKAVTLTGSGPAGAAVAEVAGAKIKKTVLELGGNNALIVMNDCDMEATLETCVKARFQNTGQSCIAGKRLLVQEEIAGDFIPKLVEKVKSLRSGDPMDKETYIGTLAREDLAEELESQVKNSLAMGATLETGGKRDGVYFQPTIVSGVTPEMPMFNEETFGPALSVTTFKTTKEAIELSNNSRFGLGVSVFSKNIEGVKNMIPELEEGAVFINELVKSDPRLPFGGVKESGYGRELSKHGIQEFTNRKTVYIKK